MRITDMAVQMVKNQQLRKQSRELKLANGSLPPKNHVNPYEDPDMDITGKSPSQWQKLVPVDDEVAEKLKNLIKEDFIKRNGMSGAGAQADAQANIIKDYIANLPGNQKLSAAYSCEQIAFGEAERLSAKIREQNPDWQYGQMFDVSMITNDFQAKA